MIAALKALFSNVVFLWIAIGAFIFIALVSIIRKHENTPLIAPEVQALQATLAKTQARDQAVIDSLKAVGQRASVSGAVLSTSSNNQLAHANVIRGRADRLAAQAVQNPTSSNWEVAYEAKAAEADTLRAALASKDSAYREATKSANAFRLAADTSDKRRLAVEGLNASLAVAVAKAQQGCRFLFIACPSRTTSAIAGVVIGAATYAIVQQRTQQPATVLITRSNLK